MRVWIDVWASSLLRKARTVYVLILNFVQIEFSWLVVSNLRYSLGKESFLRFRILIRRSGCLGIMRIFNFIWSRLWIWWGLNLKRCWAGKIWWTFNLNWWSIRQVDCKHLCPILWAGFRRAELEGNFLVYRFKLVMFVIGYWYRSVNCF